MEAYLEDTYKFELKTEITDLQTDEKGSYVLLKNTVFYPQGGGQPSDTGIIYMPHARWPIYQVRTVDSTIRHYTTEVQGHIQIGEVVNLKIDSTKRLLHARYHTAAHLLSNIIEQLLPSLKAIKGHQFPGEAYVEFQGNFEENESIIETIRSEFDKAVQHALNVQVFTAPIEESCRNESSTSNACTQWRMIKIGNFNAIPCGGTHIANTNELSALTALKFKQKGTTTKLSYKL